MHERVKSACDTVTQNILKATDALVSASHTTKTKVNQVTQTVGAFLLKHVARLHVWLGNTFGVKHELDG